MTEGKIIVELCQSIEMLKTCGVEPTVLNVSPKSFEAIKPFIKADKKTGNPVVTVNGRTLKVLVDNIPPKVDWVIRDGD